jgi:hypothetical protein
MLQFYAFNYEKQKANKNWIIMKIVSHFIMIIILTKRFIFFELKKLAIYVLY